MHTWIRTIAAFQLSFCAALAHGQEPGPLTVELVSGRVFNAQVDPLTDESHLVLRFEKETAVLQRIVQWSALRSAILNGKPMDQAALIALAGRLPDEPPGAAGPPAAPPATSADVEPRPLPPAPTSPRVASVAFDARLANWDADVETDGLFIELFPLSDEGYLVPASGSVEVELFAPQLRVFHHAPLSGGDTIERVERWTVSILADDVGPNGARLRLPFGAVHPEFDLDWLAQGLVHVKLVVPGDGVFEDSRDAVRIRPFAPLRDRLELNRGYRFLPSEGVGRRN